MPHKVLRICGRTLTPARCVAATICCVLTASACSVNLTAYSAGFETWGAVSAFFNPASLLSMLALGGSAVLHWWFWSDENRRAHASQIIAAALFALFTTGGMALDIADSLNPLDASPAARLVSLVMVAGFGLAYYALMEFAFCRVDAWRTGPHRPSPDVAAFGRWNITWRFCFVCLLVCWLPYFIVFFPGGISADTSRQMAQLFGTGGLSLDNHFPYLTTLFYGACYAAGNALGGSIVAGTAFAVAAQACICAAAFSTIVSGMRSCNAYRLSRWALYFFAFFPLVPAYVVTASKDTLHAALAALFVMQMLLVALQKRGGAPHARVTSLPALVLVAVLVCLTRNNGVFLVLPALMVIVFIARNRTAGLALGSTILCVLLWQCAVLPAANVSAGEPGEALSIPAQITGNYLSVYADELTDADAAVLARSFACSPADLASAYDPRLSDNVKSEFSFADSTALRDYLGLSAQMVARHPVSSVGAALDTTFGYGYPFRQLSYFSENSPTAPVASDWFAQIDSGWTDASRLPAWIARTAVASGILKVVSVIPGIALVYTPGAYLWLFIVIAAYRLRARRGRREGAALLVPLFALEAVLIAAPCCSLRYCLPFALSLPVVGFAIWYNQTHHQ